MHSPPPPPLHARKRLGAHVSAAGGVQKAIQNAINIHANAFAMFLKSQRKWQNPPIKEEHKLQWKEGMEKYRNVFWPIKTTLDSPREAEIKAENSGTEGEKAELQSTEYPSILPHGSYLINMGNPQQDKRDQAYEAFLDDLQRCESLDIGLYNFHPGATTKDGTEEDSIRTIAECINRAIEATTQVVIVLENMAGQGTVIGSKFEQLAAIIAQIKNKSRIGVCLDTCHMFAAGYDIRDEQRFQATLDHFDKVVGLQYLKAWHLNDSKFGLGANKDRHECIGRGEIGLAAFRFLMRSPITDYLPMILETPADENNEVSGYSNEIKLLYEIAECEEESQLSMPKWMDEYWEDRLKNKPVKAPKKKGAKAENDDEQDEEGADDDVDTQVKPKKKKIKKEKVEGGDSSTIDSKQSKVKSKTTINSGTDDATEQAFTVPKQATPSKPRVKKEKAGKQKQAHPNEKRKAEALERIDQDESSGLSDAPEN